MSGGPARMPSRRSRGQPTASPLPSTSAAPAGGTDDRDAWRHTLEQTCQWAWAAAIAPMRSALIDIHPTRRARVVLVPVDALCVVPWHAAYPASDHDLPACERRYALDSVT